MRRFLLFSLLMVLPIMGIAQKRLISITQDDGKETMRGDLTYDDQGRVTTYTYTRDGKSDYFVCDYQGDNIEITWAYRNGTDKYSYQIENEKVVSAHRFLDVDMVDENITYKYDGDGHLIKNQNYWTMNWHGDTNEGSEVTDFTWSGGNMSTAKSYHKGDPELDITFTYNNLHSEPILHALFGISDGDFGLDEFVEGIFLYPYLGTLPQNLISHISIIDHYENDREFNYDINYETDGQGDIVRIEVTHGKITQIFTLEWEGATSEENKKLEEKDDGSEDYGNGGKLDESTNLDGNIIGDIYYNIKDNDGGYNAAEGCIEIRRPTSEVDFEGKDIFGEDFKSNYTGIVFKVAPGRGTIKVNAQTQGDMMMKIKIGNNDPMEIMLNGKMDAKFPYNVSEPTYVYIYGAAFTGARGVKKAPDNVLKIYGIDWGVTDGIEEMTSESANTTHNAYYTLDGRKLQGEPSQNGLYIHQGKVILKNR